MVQIWILGTLTPNMIQNVKKKPNKPKTTQIPLTIFFNVVQRFCLINNNNKILKMQGGGQIFFIYKIIQFLYTNHQCPITKPYQPLKFSLEEGLSSPE